MESQWSPSGVPVQWGPSAVLVLPHIKLVFFSGCTIFLNPEKFDKFGYRIIPFLLNHVSSTLLVTLLAIRIYLKHGQSIIRVFGRKSSHLKIIRA